MNTYLELVVRDLGWRPPYILERGLAETARWYHARAQTSGGGPGD